MAYIILKSHGMRMSTWLAGGAPEGGKKSEKMYGDKQNPPFLAQLVITMQSGSMMISYSFLSV